HTGFSRDWSSDVCSSDLGVGKTYLVGDLVARRMQEDPTARVLLSAQSNSAIDHLMKEVQAVFKTSDGDSGPLMVRARAADDDDRSEERRVGKEARSRWAT